MTIILTNGNGDGNKNLGCFTHSDTHAHKCPGHCSHTTADDSLWWESVSICPGHCSHTTADDSLGWEAVSICPGHCSHTTADDSLGWEAVSIFELKTLAAFTTMHRCSD